MAVVLTVLQEKLAEAHALAIAATHVTLKVEERTDDGLLRRELRGLRRDAEEARLRCTALEQGLGHDLSTAVVAEANGLKDRASDLAGAWFKAGTGPLRAWSFLAMAEAGEVAVWRALDSLARRADATNFSELAAWGLPIQERHLRTALDGVVALAGLFEPGEQRWG